MPVPAALARPPRHVPWSLRLLIVGSGAFALVGWILLGIGLVLAQAFLPRSEPLFGDPFAAPRVLVDGTVTSVARTSMRVNSERLFAVGFEYTVDGVVFRNTSWSGDTPPVVGDVVPVQCVTDSPRHARIRGMRSAPFPAATWFVLLFPLLGAGLLAAAIVLGGRRLRLLRDGELASGRVVATERTGSKVNNQRVHRVTFAFKDRSGRAREGTVRTHLLAEVRDEHEEALLYEPDGEHIVPWDILPKRTAVDASGQFAPVGLLGLGVLWLPPLVVVGLMFGLDALLARALS